MNQKKIVLRGEAALVIAVIINSLGVLLMLQSGSGISAISSVPYAFHQVVPKLSLGTTSTSCFFALSENALASGSGDFTNR